jgi:hypothetical protein
LIRNLLKRLGPIRERRLQLERNMEEVRAGLKDGIERARKESSATMERVLEAVGLSGSFV